MESPKDCGNVQMHQPWFCLKIGHTPFHLLVLYIYTYIIIYIIVISYYIIRFLLKLRCHNLLGPQLLRKQFSSSGQFLHSKSVRLTYFMLADVGLPLVHGSLIDF